TINVNGPSPAATDAGDRLAATGAGFGAGVIVNVAAFDVPPPGAGVDTTTDALPTDATSDAAIAAVNRVGDTNVVGRSAPFQSTFEAETKPLPSTVSVKAPAPASAELGSSARIEGTGAGDVVA